MEEIGITNIMPSYEQNNVNYSRLRNYSQNTTTASGYGIKFVEKGKETYVIRNKVHIVKEDQYLLLNKGQGFYCNVQEKNTVHGFCISLEEDLLQKIFHQMIHSDEALLDDPTITCNAGIEFHETIYSSSDLFNQFLRKNIKRFKSQNDCFADAYEFYNEAAYQLLLSQIFTRQQIQKIKATKNSTKKEIFNRLNIAKNIIDSDVSQKLQINLLAQQSSLSEFHFFRCFKEAFGVSPHQYILNKRLTKSMELLNEGKYPVTDIAYQVGFNDLYSFSKCFKKYFKFSPSSQSHFQ